ncbi:toll/interleukin-1 receptor domain-containing protein [Geodermatophilus normandii]|uniref:Toll/interleukin-1 receptor domain-containing protein n=1 Tax=Geodermatophilus normandii TaxID=1137989 RepID=A0A6P0G9J3_9ACTN|nr:toll/interleukin-1 receptor domain-containing protein [Geodermatophilus normandii]
MRSSLGLRGRLLDAFRPPPRSTPAGGAVPGDPTASGTDTAGRPRVFLSHSGDRGVVKDVLDRLEAELGAAGFVPLVDRRMIRGTNFHAAIDTYIATCDAAVFVISQRALHRRHPWVRIEANQLRHKLVQPWFQGVPVLVEGVQPDDLQGTEWEASGLPQQDAVVGDDAETVARTVVAGLAPTRARVEASPIAGALAGKLGEIGDEQTLRDAAGAVGWDLVAPAARDLAQRLLRAEPDEVRTVALRLAPTSQAAARATLVLALPFTWVDRTAARVLDQAVRGSRPAALNTVETFTTKSYVICGASDYPVWKVIRVDALEGERPAALAEEGARTRAWAAGELEGGAPGTEPMGDPVIYAVACSRLSRELVDVFRARYRDRRDVGVVFITRGSWADDTASMAREVDLIRPELDPARERQARQVYDDAIERLQAAHRLDTGLMEEGLR